MKIVIVGEYSGFSKNLSFGFRALGHECLVFSWGDVFKKIEPDESTYLIKVGRINMFGKSIKKTGWINNILSGIKLNSFVKEHFKTKKADVVIVMNMAFLKERSNMFVPKFSNEMLLKMCKNPERIYLSSCGNDYIVNRYLPLCKRPNEYLMFKHFKKLNKQKRMFEKHIGCMNRIIPIAHDYYMAYKYYEKEYNYHVYPVIPLPFAVNTVSSENEVREKIVIMHGVSRPFEKGSYIIISALERISEDFPDEVDIRIVRNLPLKEYLKVVHDANVIVDQCYGLSNGMNTIESLSMGKVVLSGNIKEYHKAYTDLDCPVLNIEPNSEHIYNTLKELITNRGFIKELSTKSRAFAETIHDSKVVAQKYLELFGL